MKVRYIAFAATLTFGAQAMAADHDIEPDIVPALSAKKKPKKKGKEKEGGKSKDKTSPKKKKKA